MIRNNPQSLLRLSLVIFIIYFLVVAFARHDNFRSRRLDLGNMDQTVWNVLHGNGFALTDSMGPLQMSRLAGHADFLLILLAPLYLLWSSPKMLILVQTIIAGLGVFPVYWIAKDKLKSEKLALLFSILYFLYPPLERVLLHDFHAVVLSTTFLLFAYWYMEKKRYVLFCLFALLAALGKEDVWLVTGLMGLSMVITKKNTWVGLGTALVSFITFYYLFWIAIPAVSVTKQHFALVYLSEYGNDLTTILKNILTNPALVLQNIVSPDRLVYFFQILIPTGFLSILSPVTLIFALPSLLINSLSSNNLMRTIDYQYNSLITPFIFISAIDGFAVLQKIITQGMKKYRFLHTNTPTIWFCTMACISVFIWGELPLGMQSRFLFFLTPQPENEAMDTVARNINAAYSVSATNNIGAHFSERQFLYNFPVNAASADFTVVQLGDPYAWPSGDEQKKTVENLLQNTTYTLIAQQGTFYAFKRNRQSP